MTAVDTGAPLRLTTRDGVCLAARWWEPAGEAQAAVVLAHGFTGSMQERGLVALAEALHGEARAGLDVLVYDARGHGASQGDCTLGDLEQHDVAAAVAEARRRHDRVVVVGTSMGAIAVLRYAATDPDLAGVVTVSGPARWRMPRSWQGLAAAGLTQTAVGRRLLARSAGVRVARGWRWPEPPVRLAARLSAPYAIVHGTADRFIAPRDATELFTAAVEPRRLVMVPGMGHANEPGAEHAVVDAVRWALAAR